jgi:hypothetical protein
MNSIMILTMYPAKKNEADDPAKVYLKNASIEYKCTLASGTPSGLDLFTRMKVQEFLKRTSS